MQHSLRLPSLEYLTFGNVYSGSHGKFNYKLIPYPERKVVDVTVWAGMYCLEKSDPIDKQEFSLTQEGWQEAFDWVLEQQQDFEAKNAARGQEKAF